MTKKKKEINIKFLLVNESIKARQKNVRVFVRENKTGEIKISNVFQCLNKLSPPYKTNKISER